jgi:hypothetical protein
MIGFMVAGMCMVSIICDQIVEKGRKTKSKSLIILGMMLWIGAIIISARIFNEFYISKELVAKFLEIIQYK